jgi:hypothetical protein
MRSAFCACCILLLMADKGIGKPIAEEPHTLPAGAIVDLTPTTTMPAITTTTTEASNGETAAANETTDAATSTANEKPDES